MRHNSHRFATHPNQSGVDIRTVQELLRQANTADSRVRADVLPLGVTAAEFVAIIVRNDRRS